MDVIYNIGGMQFGFKFDDDKSEEELKSFLSKLRGAAVAQAYKNEIDEHRKNIFANQENMAAEHDNLIQFMSGHESKKKQFEQIGGHGEYQMNAPDRTQLDRHKTAIETYTKNIERSEKEIKLLEKMISGG